MSLLDKGFRLINERMFDSVVYMVDRQAAASEPTDSEALADRIGVLAAQIHAATAELAQLAAAFDDTRAWADQGFRSCAHWLSVHIGVDLYQGGDLVRTGLALRQLPRIAAAFAAGQLSFDKARALSHVALPEDETRWLEVARYASGAQLSRICRAVRRALEADDPRRADDALCRRGVRHWWRDDGMLELLAVLPREDGAVVLAALEAATDAIARERHTAPGHDASGQEPGYMTRGRLLADGLTQVCQDWVSRASVTPVSAPTTQVVVHVDAATLQGDDAAGRCHIEAGPWLGAASLRWMSCDADRVSVLERDGLPIDTGRASRVIPPRLRLALQARDQGCRYPGCSVPAPRTEGHHVRHWVDGGPTRLNNLVSLCRFHHRRHHEGKFQVHPLPGGGFQFETSDGVALAPIEPQSADQPLASPPDITSTSAVALGGGESCDFQYAVSVIAEESAAARAVNNRDP
jgi:Domain of unknown function (DUF222)/HNH endonuclease